MAARVGPVTGAHSEATGTPANRCPREQTQRGPLHPESTASHGCMTLLGGCLIPRREVPSGVTVGVFHIKPLPRRRPTSQRGCRRWHDHRHRPPATASLAWFWWRGRLSPCIVHAGDEADEVCLTGHFLALALPLRGGHEGLQRCALVPPPRGTILLWYPGSPGLCDGRFHFFLLAGPQAPLWTFQCACSRRMGREGTRLGRRQSSHTASNDTRTHPA